MTIQPRNCQHPVSHSLRAHSNHQLRKHLLLPHRLFPMNVWPNIYVGKIWNEDDRSVELRLHRPLLVPNFSVSSVMATWNRVERWTLNHYVSFDDIWYIHYQYVRTYRDSSKLWLKLVHISCWDNACSTRWHFYTFHGRSSCWLALVCPHSCCYQWKSLLDLSMAWISTSKLCRHFSLQRHDACSSR